MKDWDYWKERFKQDRIERYYSSVNFIESKITSPIEKIAMVAILNFVDSEPFPRDYHVSPQHKIGKYVVDILLMYQPTGLNIVIECDGHDFHEKTKEQAEHDKRRDRYFSKNGFIVLRYTGSQICNNPYEIVEDITDLVYTDGI